MLWTWVPRSCDCSLVPSRHATLPIQTSRCQWLMSLTFGNICILPPPATPPVVHSTLQSPAAVCPNHACIDEWHHRRALAQRSHLSVSRMRYHGHMTSPGNHAPRICHQGTISESSKPQFARPLTGPLRSSFQTQLPSCPSPIRAAPSGLFRVA